ncbi:VOC family protein [Brachybacterium alimentarium]|uniref:VOC family protein n=1 Tax=Brachybacterium alimentarium TaxID=47845 RepID=UPI003FD4C92A
MQLHHVQVSMPRGEEAAARRFFGEAIGLVEVDKPSALEDRGGCWFRSHDSGRVTAEIHVGVEDPFVPATKAHPGLLVDSLTELEAMASRLEGIGCEVSWAERDSFDGYVRFHTRDPFGNRVEIMTPG